MSRVVIIKKRLNGSLSIHQFNDIGDGYLSVLLTVNGLHLSALKERNNSGQLVKIMLDLFAKLNDNNLIFDEDSPAEATILSAKLIVVGE